MSLRIRKVFDNLPISLKMLCGLLSVCLVLTAISGIVHYGQSRDVIVDSIHSQASALCEHLERRFEMCYAAPIEHDLSILATAPQLDNYLMSSQEEMLLHRAEIEMLFLNLSRERDIYLSTTFLDALGREKAGVAGNLRKRTFKSLAEIAREGPVGRSMKELFTELKTSKNRSVAYRGPFRDARNRQTILVGMAKQDPEAGGFGGAVIQHCDLTGFLDEVSRRRILGIAVMWVYGSNGDNLLSPSEDAVRQDPACYLGGGRAPSDAYFHTIQCRLFGTDGPVMTVACSVPRELVSRQLAPALWSVVITFSILLIGALVGSLLISRWIAGPIRNLTQAVRTVSGRSLDIELDAGLMESKDEMGVLAQAFKKTLQDLRASTTSIDHLNREIAERRNAEEALRQSEERFRRYFELGLIGMAITSPTKGWIDVNDQVCEILGYERGELLETTWTQLTHPDDLAADTAQFDRLLAGASDGYTMEKRFIRKDGQITYTTISLKCLRRPDGSVDYLVVLLQDITARKHAEQEQSRLLRQLGEINRELTDFAYVVSHDLKAPLRAIRSIVDWLNADYGDKFDDQGREYLKLLVGRATRMHNLIDGVLQYSRIGRTEMKAEPVDLNALVPEIVESLGAPGHISIEIETDLPTIRANTTRITQVFQNLLSNAIKYMDKPQGRIAVACVEGDDSWTFSVSDNGPGIERKNTEQIFKLFQTLAPRDDHESTGVGLTVTKKIVEMYGGNIWVESEVGRGSTFLFTLPKHSERMTYEECQACAAG